MRAFLCFPECFRRLIWPHREQAHSYRIRGIHIIPAPPEIIVGVSLLAMKPELPAQNYVEDTR